MPHPCRLLSFSPILFPATSPEHVLFGPSLLDRSLVSMSAVTSPPRAGSRSRLNPAGLSLLPPFFPLPLQTSSSPSCTGPDLQLFPFTCGLSLLLPPRRHSSAACASSKPTENLGSSVLQPTTLAIEQLLVSPPYHRDSACHAVLSVFDGRVFPRRLGRLRADTCLISLCPPVHDGVAAYASWPHRAITPFLLLSSEWVLEKRHRRVNHTLTCHVLCPGQRPIRAPGRELEPQASESDGLDLSPSSTT